MHLLLMSWYLASDLDLYMNMKYTYDYISIVPDYAQYKKVCEVRLSTGHMSTVG